MLDLRSTLFLRFRFLRATRLLGVQSQSHVPRQIYQDPGHLYRSQFLEHGPFVLRNRDHHSPVSHRNLVGQVIPRHLLFDGLRAWTARNAALITLIRLYDTNATQKANNAALG